MNEQHVRDIIRDGIGRHLVGPVRPPGPEAGLAPERHASHARYLGLVNDAERCLIEPTVPCSHCGYCESHGH